MIFKNLKMLDREYRTRSRLVMSLLITVMIPGLLILVGCNDNEGQLSELIEAHDAELKLEYERGKRVGLEEGLSLEQEEVFKRGKSEGYSQGFAEGQEEVIREKEETINLLQQQTDNQTGEFAKARETIGTLQARIDDLNRQSVESEAREASLQETIRNIREEREMLLDRLRKAIERIEDYEREGDN